jgi:hypothetical protein
MVFTSAQTEERAPVLPGHTGHKFLFKKFNALDAELHVDRGKEARGGMKVSMSDGDNLTLVFR